MSLAGKKRRAKKAQKVQESASSKNDSTPTKSSKKRDKKLKNPDHVHESKGQSKALRYLKLWYANKKCKEDESVEPWKFEKCRQIWLLQNAYTSKVPPEDFKILVKYMATINGRMRDSAIDDAKEKVELTQKWSNLSETGKNEIEIEKEIGKPKPDDITTKRAKKVLKKLNKDADVVSSHVLSCLFHGFFLMIHLKLEIIHSVYLFQNQVECCYKELNIFFGEFHWRFHF